MPHLINIGIARYIILFLCILPLPVFAQQMSVVSFRIDKTDQTANVSPTMRIDINGEKCALIKIATTQKNFSFDVGSLGVTAIEWQNSEHPGEIWLYVPNGVMKISIQHPQFGSIKDYDLGGRLKKGRTYVMDLTSYQVNTLAVDYDNSQILDIDITPHDADLYINGLKQSLDFNGHVSITLPFGTHNYRVVANNYHPEESQVIINDKENKHQLSVRLKQAFGYLTVKSTPESNGGELYIDDVRVGALPISKFPLKSGMHQLSVYQKLYLPYSEKVAMTDSATVEITPILKPNFSEFEIFVDGDNDAQIYDNGELIGTGHWKGNLETGEHIIETKKISHTTITQKINVVKDTPRKVSLSKPMPIYGTLEVKTQPSNAKVYVDGSSKETGVTDFIDNHLLIGKHHIKIVLPRYKTEEFDVYIKEGQTEYINKVLTDICSFFIFCNPSAKIAINGQSKGWTPYYFERESGKYKIELSSHGYSHYSKTIYFDANSKNLSVILKPNYIRPNEFYIQFGGYFGGMISLTGGLGGFYHKYNFEINYMTNCSKIRFDGVMCDHRLKVVGMSFITGYGIRLNSRIRFTPQIGYQILANYDDYYICGPYHSLLLGFRCNFVLSRCLGISISPQYLFKISECISEYDNLKMPSDYTDGLHCSVSLNLFF